MNVNKLQLVITEQTLAEYEKYYFGLHPRAKKRPIPHPYHESINQWMIMKRPMMNALKQKWKDFIVWFVDQQGYANLRIEKCEISFRTYYGNNRRHDPDNSCPKFLIDGLCEGGLLVDDDNKHIARIALECYVDEHNPRTEINITILEENANG
jgi:hypothetical protein